MNECNDPVLIYETSRCIHEMVKEIEQQIKKQESGDDNRVKFVQGNLFSGEVTFENEKEEQINLSIQINRQIDYA